MFDLFVQLRLAQAHKQWHTRWQTQTSLTSLPCPRGVCLGSPGLNGLTTPPWGHHPFGCAPCHFPARAEGLGPGPGARPRAAMAGCTPGGVDAPRGGCSRSKVCAFCWERFEGMRRCECKQVAYCNTQCQMRDWGRHRWGTGGGLTRPHPPAPRGGPGGYRPHGPHGPRAPRNGPERVCVVRIRARAPGPGPGSAGARGRARILTTTARRPELWAWALGPGPPGPRARGGLVW